MARLKFAVPKLGAMERPLRLLRRHLPPLDFITIHYLYFVVTCMLGSLIIWGSANPPRSLTYTDALFLSVSAMTEAGLNTVNLSTLNTFQQFWLFLEIILGSAIFVSSFVVLVRRRAFDAKFRDVIKKQREAERERKDRSRSRGHKKTWSWSSRTAQNRIVPVIYEEKQADDLTHDSDNSAKEVSEQDKSFSASTGESELGIVSGDSERRNSASEHASPESLSWHTSVRSPRKRISTDPDRRGSDDKNGSDSRPSLLRTAGGYVQFLGEHVARKREIDDLTDKERERLGGCEYRAVKILSWLVPLYFVAWQLLGSLGCAAWVILHRPDTVYANSLQPGWVGAFNAVSAFNNSGMSLLDANMTAFQDAYYLLLTMGLLILAGNTAYPIFLRLIIWSMYQAVKQLDSRFDGWDEHVDTLKFLLDHPRRCYTNLFPAQHTWWLVLCLISLNGIDWAAFEILNIGNTQINLSHSDRVIDGLFQALAVRSGGFYVVAILSVRISLQVLYVVMMYISVYPVVITMRNSNVYVDRSLGIYSAEDKINPIEQPSGETPGFLRSLTDQLVRGSGSNRQSNFHFVRHQLRAQIANDAWTIVVALFLIMIIEGSQFNQDPAQFSVFNFLFEIVSGYGCVGISVGLQDEAYSFCGSWHVLSKLILCVVMLRGRHRGLPVAIDRAVLLPGEETEEQYGTQSGRARTSTRGGGGDVA